MKSSFKKLVASGHFWLAVLLTKVTVTTVGLAIFALYKGSVSMPIVWLLLTLAVVIVATIWAEVFRFTDIVKHAQKYRNYRVVYPR